MIDIVFHEVEGFGIEPLEVKGDRRGAVIVIKHDGDKLSKIALFNKREESPLLLPPEQPKLVA